MSTARATIEVSASRPAAQAGLQTGTTILFIMGVSFLVSIQLLCPLRTANDEKFSWF
jgi:hypothetical protein